MHAEVLTSNPSNNVPENIFAKIGANLHLRRDHPICMIKDTIYSYFDKLSPGLYEKFDELKPVVSTRAVRHPSSAQSSLEQASHAASLIWLCSAHVLLSSLRCLATSCASHASTDQRAVQNFDEVLVPPDHVSRSPNDTYYIDPDTVLRCHTSAHQCELLRQGHSAFLVTGTLAAGYQVCAHSANHASPQV